MSLLKKVLEKRNDFKLEVDTGQETVEVDRSQYIGGSDIPIILGISGFTKASKLAQLKNKVIPYENKKTLYTEFGHIFEPSFFWFVRLRAILPAASAMLFLIALHR